jgi:hypothetical protein
MDFQTMRKKLAASEYATTQDFIDDIQLICDNAKKFNGAASMYGLITDDIMAEVHKQYSEKPSSTDEEWYKTMMKTIQALNDHMKEAPVDVSQSSAYLDPPDFATLKLSSEATARIQREIGNEKIANLGKKWLLLSEAVRGSIISVINDDTN